MKNHRPIGWWAVPTLLAALGASPPEVVKIRVPSDKISSWFPPGSDLRVLPFDRFEALVKAAHDRAPAVLGPRLLKARHSARVESGVLIGQTELTVEGGAGLLILDPWSPALDGRGPGASSLRADAEGRLGVVVGPVGRSTLAFDWSLRARPGSDGRAYVLALPGVDLSSLTLDLPAGLVPEAPAGVRVGPDASGISGRRGWRFEGVRGRFELRLVESSEATGPAGGSGLWLEGPTRVDLSASSIPWRADWTLDQSPGSSRTLTIGLDPGLELVDVSGPRVASFRPELAAVGSKVAIRLDGEGSGPSSLTIRATCRVPAEGAWAIPSARPLDATWTGGRTIVRPDPARAFPTCVERSGRRVAPRPGDGVDTSALVFEPRGEPGPVAELTFRAASGDATVEVRGHLRIGDDVPRIEVALTWTVEKGRLPALAADLPPGWTTEGVVSSIRQPVPWHADALGNGGTRVHLGTPPLDDAGRSVTLTLSASAGKAGATGPLDLPRVRPSTGVRVVDEVWVASSDPGLAVRPILARGVAWLDPPDPPIDDVPTPWVAADLDGALAWRWSSEGAEARIDRVPPRDVPRGEAKLEATIRSGRLALDWSVEVESPRGGIDAIPIHLDEPAGSVISWKSREPGGPIVEARVMDDARRASLGLPTTGQAWDLIPNGPTRRRIQLQGRAERPWPGRGRLPLLTWPVRYRGRGSVVVAVEDSTRVKFSTSGLDAIEPPSPGDPLGPVGNPVPVPGSRMRRAGLFGYRAGGGRLEVETTPSAIGRGNGLVREAFLVSHLSPGSGIRHRLSLTIAADASKAVEFAMPEGVALDRLRRDGSEVDPTASGGRFRVDVSTRTPGRPLCTLTLEYRTGDDPASTPLDPCRLLPSCSLPCLGFAWEIVAPEPWALDRVDRGLEPTDPRPSRSIASRLLGFPEFPGSKLEPKASTVPAAGMVLDLDKAALEIAGGESNLGDWLLKLDAGRWPIVVDGLAIRSGGWGPGSRVEVVSGGPARSIGPVRSVLDPMGLVAEPVGGVILVTSSGEVPEGLEARDALTAALRAVPWEDSDPTDRFQSPARWRGETTPRAPTSGASTDRPTRSGRWHAWRVVSGGWPPRGSTVSMVDLRADRARGWVVASAVLAAGLLSRRASARARGVGLAAVGIAATLGLAWQWPGSWSIGSGLLRGALGVLAFWLGRSLRKGRRTASARGSEGSAAGRPSGVLVGVAGGLIVAVGFGVGPSAIGAQGEADLEPPILALLPFDGPADPGSRPDRVVMLVKDHDRLERLARGPDRPPPSGVLVRSAIHKVARDGPSLASVESTFEVEVEGPGPASWSIPVGPALELSSEREGRPTPLAVSPDGLSATATLPGPGLHRLRFRRLVRLSKLARGGERARLPIPRSAFARVEVAKGATSSWVEVVDPAGVLVVEAEGIEGVLGPRDVLEVRWLPDDLSPNREVTGPVEATTLWDARPGGDLFRMRLSHASPEGASTIRLAAEAGLMIRRHSIPGLVSIRRDGTAERPGWVAHVDPPWPANSPIEVDFWRPVALGTDERRWPDLDLPDAGKITGLIGFRRPGDWSGRLEPKGGVDPAPEASFARSWGTPLDDGLTLAGAVRFARSRPLEVSTAPLASRRMLKTRVVVGLGPGRLRASIEAILADHRGRTFELEASIPAEFRVVRVESDGLVDWRKPARDRLRLQFNGTEAASRPILIEGYLPAPAESPMSESRGYEAKVPWPTWLEVDQDPPVVEIAGASKFQVEPTDGLEAIAPVGPADPEAPFRSSFRVDRASGPATVRWSSPPSRVAVAVDSELAIDPASMTWSASLACVISGGPAESFTWQLPTEWAEVASVELEGQSHRLVSQKEGARGETTVWKILPESPVWGRARLVLRARLPSRPGVEFAYPHVAPRAMTGRGSVVRYDLAIANGTGRSMEVGGSSGLQPIDTSRFRPVDASPASIDHAYHVTGERWALRLKVGRAGQDGSADPGDGRGKVASEQVFSVLEADGSAWGRAHYFLESRTGPFLGVRLAEPATIAWASVDGVVVPPMGDGPGTWLIPLGDRDPRRVTLVWRLPEAGGIPLDRGTIPLPSLDRPAPVSLVSVEAPTEIELSTSGSTLEPLDRLGAEAEVVEPLARRVVESFGTLDRGSRRDREAILEDLVEIELRIRRVSRDPLASGPAAASSMARLQGALGLIAEASQASGLEELVQEARARVGVARAVDDSAEDLPVWSPDVSRLRRSARRQDYRATAGGASIDWSAKVPTPASHRAGTWAIGGLGILLWTGIGALIARGIRPSGRLATGLVLLASLPLMVWEPVGTLSGLGLMGFGRVSD